MRVINCRMSPWAKPSEHILCILFLALVCRFIAIGWLRKMILRAVPWLDTLSSADFVGDVRGGDSFSDIYGLKRFITGSLPALSAIFMQKPLVLLPQTIGPFRSPLALALARFIMRRSGEIFSRDKAGVEIARKIVGASGVDKKIRFCPEVAFTLETRLPNDAEIIPPLPAKGNVPLIGLNVSGLLYMGGYTRDNMFGLKVDYKKFIETLLVRLMEKTNAHVFLVPHVFDANPENDCDACLRVWRDVPEPFQYRVHLPEQMLDQNQVKGLIGLCDFFIGARMHSCIAALSQGIPTVGIAYSSKFTGVFESVGMASAVLDARGESLDALVETCLEHFRNRIQTSTELRKRVAAIQIQIFSCFNALLAPSSVEIASRANAFVP